MPHFKCSIATCDSWLSHWDNADIHFHSHRKFFWAAPIRNYWKGKKKSLRNSKTQNFENSLSLECRLHEQLFVFTCYWKEVVLCFPVVFVH